MPYVPGNNTINDIITLSGDVEGSLLQNKVTSVNNVTSGILNVNNGGTGLQSFISGGILYADSYSSIGFITGLEGDVLKYVNGTWVAAPETNLSDVQISTTDNSLFDLIETRVGNNKIYRMQFQPVGQGLIFGTNISSTIPQYRKLDTNDIPEVLENKTIFNSNYSGVSQGLSGTFIGVFSGNGEYINNIQFNNISNITESIKSVVGDIDHLRIENINCYNITASNSVIDNAIINNSSISGSFYGDGSGIYNLSASKINNINELIDAGVKSNLTSSNFIYYKDYIKFEVQEKIDSYGINDLANIVSGAIVNNIINDGIVKNSINNTIENKITSSGVLDIKIPEEKIFNSSNNISVTVLGNNITHNLASNISCSTITANYIGSNNIIGKFTGEADADGVFRGAFSGDGSLLGNLKSYNIDKNFISINNNPVYLGDSIILNGIDDISGSNNIKILTISSSKKYLVDLNENISLASANFTSDVKANSVVADVFSGSQYIGDGSGLTNISISNINNIDDKIINLIYVDDNNIKKISGSISLSENITTNNIFTNNITSSRIISTDATIQNISTNNLLLNNINSNTANFNSCIVDNFVSSSYFVGDGSNLINISFDSLINKPTYSDYGFANKYELDNVYDELNNKIQYTLKTIAYNGYVYNISNIQNNNLVSLTNNGFVKSNKNSKILSEVVGIVSQLSGSEAIIQNCGQVIFSTPTFIPGEKIFLGNNGEICRYEDVLIGEYLVLVGRAYDEYTLILDIKKMWKKN